MLDELPKDRPPAPATRQEEYQEFLKEVRPMTGILDLGEGLSEVGIAAARSTARIAAKAKRLTNRWRGR